MSSALAEGLAGCRGFGRVWFDDGEVWEVVGSRRAVGGSVPYGWQRQDEQLVNQPG